jgi:hypothetical protein
MLKWLFILITIKINDFLSWKQLEVAVECHCLELTHKGKDKLNNKEIETFPKTVPECTSFNEQKWEKYVQHHRF